MVELSTPIKSWNSKEYDCNRRVAGSIPVRLNLFFYIFLGGIVDNDLFYYVACFPLFLYLTFLACNLSN